MHSLVAITPLGGTEARIDGIGKLTITEIIDVALASVTCRSAVQAGFNEAAGNHFGCALPSPGRMIHAEPYTIFWTGPDQWFVEAPLVSHEGLAAILKSTFLENASVTEQTDGWARFDIEGENVVALLQRLCPADTKRMQSGYATRTMIEHLGCYLICRRQGVHFSILGPRSSAASLHHALCAAAKSIA